MSLVFCTGKRMASRSRVECRRDATACEFQGNDDLSLIGDSQDVTMKGNRPDPATLPSLMGRDCSLRFVFDDPQRCRCHARAQGRSEQRPGSPAGFEGERSPVRGGALPTGLGIQYSVPTHRAFPADFEFELPGGALQEGSIGLEAHPEATTGLPGTCKRRNCCCGRQPIAFLTTGVGRDR